MKPLKLLFAAALTYYWGFTLIYVLILWNTSIPQWYAFIHQTTLNIMYVYVVMTWEYAEFLLKPSYQMLKTFAKPRYLISFPLSWVVYLIWFDWLLKLIINIIRL